MQLLYLRFTGALPSTCFLVFPAMTGLPACEVVRRVDPSGRKLPRIWQGCSVSLLGSLPSSLAAKKQPYFVCSFVIVLPSSSGRV